MNTLRDYEKLHKIINNPNGKAFFEAVKNNGELYMFFSFDKLCVWHKGLSLCTVGAKGIHSMTESFEERAQKTNHELKNEIKVAGQKNKFDIYSKNLPDIMKIVDSGKGKQLERENQQEIAKNNKKLEDFHILCLEFAIPEKIIECKPEFDYLAVDTAKKIIYLIEYKCTYSATVLSSSNLMKHYSDMKEIGKHSELIINTVENLWHLEKGELKNFSEYRIIPAFLFTNFNEFTPTQKRNINNYLNDMKNDSEAEIIIWNFDKPEKVNFSDEPQFIKDFEI